MSCLLRAKQDLGKVLPRGCLATTSGFSVAARKRPHGLSPCSRSDARERRGVLQTQGQFISGRPASSAILLKTAPAGKRQSGMDMRTRRRLGTAELLASWLFAREFRRNVPIVGARMCSGLPGALAKDLGTPSVSGPDTR